MSRITLLAMTSIAVCVCCLSISTLGEPFSNAASVFDLCMGARPFSMGNAFVGLADDGNSILYNAAGLAWSTGLSLLSSYEARPDTAAYGNIAVSLPRFGVALHYFDFGDVPETDEFGNTIGIFSYSAMGFVAAAAMKASDLPLFSRVSLADHFSLGIGARFLHVSTLDPGSGTGFGLDFSGLYRIDSPSPRVPAITGYGLGMVVENLTGLPIKYGNGHQEDWPTRMVVGTFVELADQMILAIDFNSEQSFCVGVEWTPIQALSLRGGIKNVGPWVWSFGVGLRFSGFAFDFSIVPHTYLNSQLRGSFTVEW